MIKTIFMIMINKMIIMMIIIIITNQIWKSNKQFAQIIFEIVQQSLIIAGKRNYQFQM